MKLRKGDKAVSFKMKDIFDKDVDLSALKGHKVYLSFFRNTSCPFCNLRAYQFIKMVPRLQDKIKMIFIFESRKDYLLNSTFTENLQHIHVISDPEKQLYQLYGVESSAIKRMSTVLSSKYSAQLKAFKELNIEISKDEKGIDNNLIPADFLVNEDQEIVELHYGKNITDRMDEEIIVKFAEAKQAVIS